MGKKFGVSFSAKRALGISGVKSKISRKTGIPLTASGQRRKIGRAAGCCVPIIFAATLLVSLLILPRVCLAAPEELASPTVLTLPDGREILVKPNGMWEFVGVARPDGGSPGNKPDEAETVYVTRTGTKYHRTGCRHLRSSRTPMPLEEAVSRYEPCSVCSPPTRSAGASGGAPGELGIQSSPAPSAPRVTTAPAASSGGGQCRATTRQGTRCKRSAKAGSAYCWQHGG